MKRHNGYSIEMNCYRPSSTVLERPTRQSPQLQGNWYVIGYRVDGTPCCLTSHDTEEAALTTAELLSGQLKHYSRIEVQKCQRFTDKGAVSAQQY